MGRKPPAKPPETPKPGLVAKRAPQWWAGALAGVGALALIADAANGLQVLRQVGASCSQPLEAADRQAVARLDEFRKLLEKLKKDTGNVYNDSSELETALKLRHANPAAASTRLASYVDKLDRRLQPYSASLRLASRDQESLRKLQDTDNPCTEHNLLTMSLRAEWAGLLAEVARLSDEAPGWVLGKPIPTSATSRDRAASARLSAKRLASNAAAKLAAAQWVERSRANSRFQQCYENLFVTDPGYPNAASEAKWFEAEALAATELLGEELSEKDAARLHELTEWLNSDYEVKSDTPAGDGSHRSLFGGARATRLPAR